MEIGTESGVDNDTTSGSTGPYPDAQVQVAAAGRATVDGILAAVTQLQAKDPMRAVDVVSINAVAAGQLHRAMLNRITVNESVGLVGVTSATVNGLARRLLLEATGDPTARLASRLEVGVAVRNELADDPGHFGDLANHRTTIERLVAFFQELAGLPSSDFDALHGAAEGLQADAVRVVIGALGRLQNIWSESAAIDVVTAHLNHLDTDLPTGVVLVNPDPFRPFEVRLIEALLPRQEVITVVSQSADEAGDEQYGQRLARLNRRDASNAGGGPWRSGQPRFSTMPPDKPAGVRSPELVEVASPDDEVRSALRRLSALAAGGVPLSRMALLYTTADPYADIIESQMSLADLPWSGPGHRPLAASVAGRVLRHCLRLALAGVDRAGLLALVGTAPILDGAGQMVPAVHWDRLTRQAGVIEPDHWSPRLDELRAAFVAEQRSGSGGHVHPEVVDRSKLEADEATNIQRFVVELEQMLAPPPRPSWQAWARWAERLVRRYTQPDCDAAGWPDGELQSRERVLGILSELATLDHPDDESLSSSHGPTLATVDATIDLELSGLTMPGRPSGVGLFVADINSAAGLPFEAITVVGSAEGRFPRAPQENPLLPRKLRARSSRYLTDESQVTVADTRSLALVADAGRLGTTFYVARGDMRSSRTRDAPAQVLSLVGSTTTIESHFRGLIDDGRPASLHDFGLRSLASHWQAGIPLEVHGLTAKDGALQRGLNRHQDLQANRLGSYSGRVQSTLLDVSHHVFSPTALETYAACPRKYLLARVLRLGEQRRPERITSIDGLERGSLVHRILERFVAEAIDECDVPDPHQAWPQSRRQRLMELVDEEVKLARSRGVTGGEVHTEILRLELIREMKRFLIRDDEFRRTHRSRPVGTEYAFGFQDKPLTVTMADGRALSLRGSVDRVDVTDDDGLVVIDYKGGKGTQYKDVVDNPLDAGRRLQLPLYARALATSQDRTGSRTGVYWLTSVDKTIEMELDQVDVELQDVVGTALDGIEGGLFPAIPGQPELWPRLTHTNCRFCDFDALCPTDRRREWELVRQDPGIRLIERLRKNGELLGQIADDTDGSEIAARNGKVIGEDG